MRWCGEGLVAVAMSDDLIQAVTVLMEVVPTTYSAKCLVHITVSHVLYLVTKEVLHQILDAYGVEEMTMSPRAAHAEVVVQL